MNATEEPNNTPSSPAPALPPEAAAPPVPAPPAENPATPEAAEAPATPEPTASPPPAAVPPAAPMAQDSPTPTAVPAAPVSTDTSSGTPELSAEVEAEIAAAMSDMDAAAGTNAPNAAPPTRAIRGPRVVQGGREHRKGIVVSIGPDDVFIEFGPKELGVASRKPFEEVNELPIVGSTLEVVIERFDSSEGLFICAACYLPLFESSTKFESGTGWPSFFEPIDGAVGTTVDRSHWMVRTEVHCARCQIGRASCRERV